MKTQAELTELWNQRALVYGRRCVLDLAIPDSDFEAMTEFQKQSLLPLLKAQLNGTEIRALDFGAGCCRFSNDLQKTIGRRCVVWAYDPSEEVLLLSNMLDPRVLQISALSEASMQFDVIWIALVLGGIPDALLPEIATTISAVAAPNALLFMAEHVGAGGNDFWHFRSEDAYKALFPNFALERVGGYMTRGTEVAVLAGRKIA